MDLKVQHFLDVRSNMYPRVEPKVVSRLTVAGRKMEKIKSLVFFSQLRAMEINERELLADAAAYLEMIGNPA